MNKIYIIGNCQAETISFLIEHMIPHVSVHHVDTTSFAFRQNGRMDELLREALKADHIFLVRGSLWDPQVQNELIASGKTTVLQNLFFRGLHPDIGYVGNLETRNKRPSSYHSASILDSFLKGHSVAKAARAVCYDSFLALGLMDAWQSSLAEMEERDQKVDVPAAALIDAFCREHRGFLTINHPTVNLVYRYLILALRHADMRFHHFNPGLYRDPMDELDTLPIHDFVAEAHRLPYRTSQLWSLNYPSRHFLNLEEYVAACYAAYKTLPRRELVLSSPLDLIASLKEHGHASKDLT